MVLKIVGIETQDFKLDNGYTFKGRKLHCIDVDSEKTGLVGCMVTNTVKISDDHPLASIPLAVDKSYTAYFDQKGKLDYLAEYKEK